MTKYQVVKSALGQINLKGLLRLKKHLDARKPVYLGGPIVYKGVG